MRVSIVPAVMTALLHLSLGSAARAENMGGMVVVSKPSDIAWAEAPSSLPKSTKLVVVMGDPEKPGPFVLRVMLPANTLIAPHTHATPETLTILSGAIRHDMGETVDKTKGNEVEAGGFVYLPADMPHSLWTAGEAATLQVNGTGPFGLTYVDPADDPSKAR